MLLQLAVVANEQNTKEELNAQIKPPQDPRSVVQLARRVPHELPEAPMINPSGGQPYVPSGTVCMPMTGGSSNCVMVPMEPVPVASTTAVGASPVSNSPVSLAASVTSGVPSAPMPSSVAPSMVMANGGGCEHVPAVPLDERKCEDLRPIGVNMYGSATRRADATRPTTPC